MASVVRLYHGLSVRSQDYACYESLCNTPVSLEHNVGLGHNGDSERKSDSECKRSSKRRGNSVCKTDPKRRRGRYTGSFVKSGTQ